MVIINYDLEYDTNGLQVVMDQPYLSHSFSKNIFSRGMKSTNAREHCPMSVFIMLSIFSDIMRVAADAASAHGSTPSMYRQLEL
jgi:hypothetical protein